MQPNLISLVVLLVSTFAALAQTDKAQPLSPTVKEAIIDALVSEDGEYAVRAKYAAMVEKFGQVQPYAFIRNAENYHILALEGHLKKNGIAPPTDRFMGKVTAPASLPEAAAEAVRLEERCVASYDRLLKAAVNDTELTRVVLNLQRMARDSHLPAFKAAAESGGKLTADQIRARAWQKRSGNTRS